MGSEENDARGRGCRGATIATLGEREMSLSRREEVGLRGEGQGEDRRDGEMERGREGGRRVRGMVQEGCVYGR